jgi:hypothetical protein
MSKEARAARWARIRAFFSGIPSLTRFLIVSMTAIVAYTVVLIWIRVHYDIWIDTDFSRLWYAYWGSEIFLCSGLKIGKLIVNRSNPYTNQSNTIGTNSDDAVG